MKLHRRNSRTIQHRHEAHSAGAADVLEAKWIGNAQVVYVGKGDNLRRRLTQYADSGARKPIGHWGGRYVWQLADSADLRLDDVRRQWPKRDYSAIQD